MPRYDQKYTNEEIAQMTDALRQQANALSDHLSMAQAMLHSENRTEVLTNHRIQALFTDIGLAAQNLSIEADVLWRKTRA